MNGNRRWNAGWIAVACVCACAAESRATVQSLRSPDGRNEIRLSTEPELTYSVLRDGVALVPPSRLGLAVEGRGAFGGAGAKIVSTDMVTLSGEVPAPIYRKATVSLAANECTVAFEGVQRATVRRLVIAGKGAKLTMKDTKNVIVEDSKLPAIDKGNSTRIRVDGKII